MTKELRSLVNRVRKAQDYIFSGKAGDRVSITMDMSDNFLTVRSYRHYDDHSGVEASKHFYLFSNTTVKEFSAALSAMSQIVGFDI